MTYVSCNEVVFFQEIVKLISKCKDESSFRLDLSNLGVCGIYLLSSTLFCIFFIK